MSNSPFNKLLPRGLKGAALATMIIAVAGMSSVTRAQQGFASPHIAQAEERRPTISKSEAAAMAQQRHGGKVLSVSEQRRSGGVVYVVKLLLDSGRVKFVTIRG